MIFTNLSSSPDGLLSLILSTSSKVKFLMQSKSPYGNLLTSSLDSLYQFVSTPFLCLQQWLRQAQSQSLEGVLLERHLAISKKYLISSISLCSYWQTMYRFSITSFQYLDYIRKSFFLTSTVIFWLILLMILRIPSSCFFALLQISFMAPSRTSLSVSRRRSYFSFFKKQCSVRSSSLSRANRFIERLRTVVFIFYRNSWFSLALKLFMMLLTISITKSLEFLSNQAGRVIFLLTSASSCQNKLDAEVKSIFTHIFWIKSRYYRTWQVYVYFLMAQVRQQRNIILYYSNGYFKLIFWRFKLTVLLKCSIYTWCQQSMSSFAAVG